MEIVTSRAYRQASLPSTAGMKKDAETRLVWRKRPVRMGKEVLAASLLAVAGARSGRRRPGLSD